MQRNEVDLIPKFTQQSFIEFAPGLISSCISNFSLFSESDLFPPPSPHHFSLHRSHAGITLSPTKPLWERKTSGEEG